MTLPDRFHATSKEILNHDLVHYLYDLIEDQSIEIANLKKEIRILKDHSAKPSIRPNSNLEGAKSHPLQGVKKNFSH